MVKLAEKFVPILVDGDVDQEFGTTYGADGFPHTIFADAKGKELLKIAGAVPTAEFLDGMKGVVKKLGTVQLRKPARDLQEASAAMAKAREKGDWRAILKAANAVLKIDHPGKELDSAREAKAAAVVEADKRLDAAKTLLAAEKKDEARAALGKIVSEFEGLDAAAAAKKILAEPAAPPPTEQRGQTPGAE